jgi:hypothetical protein
MTLRRRLHRLVHAQKLLDRHEALGATQNTLIAELLDENRQLKIDHARDMHGVVLGWLLSMERPEVDLREEVVAMERALGNTLATLEEHIL